MENIKHIIESLLFVAETPLTIDEIKKALLDAETDDIRDALNALSLEYDTRKGGFYLNEVAGGYQLRTRPEYTDYLKRLLQPKRPRMSKAALETLAIIAYKQPIIRSDIEHIRGVDSGGILRMLIDRNLIRILSRRKIPGRPLVYGTTKLFLEMFDLKDLKDLPTPKEIESLEGDIADSDQMPENYDADPNQMQLFETEEVQDNALSEDIEMEDASYHIDRKMIEADIDSSQYGDDANTVHDNMDLDADDADESEYNHEY